MRGMAVQLHIALKKNSGTTKKQHPLSMERKGGTIPHEGLERNIGK
jgi:hypothetical protein